MSLKRWLCFFLGAVLLGALAFSGFNYGTDPFGVFGDRFLSAYSYNMTENPRTSKIAYLDEHHEEYDSYIIGCSKTSSISTAGLNAGFEGANFYNMLMYGGDLLDAEQTCLYILENYEVKNIVVNMGLEELVYYNVEDDPIKGQMHAKTDGSSVFFFYLRHLALHPSYGINKLKALDKAGYLPGGSMVFQVEDGAYDKRLRDVEPIGDLGAYLEKYPDFLAQRERFDTLPEAENCLASIQRMKAACEEKGVSFTLVISPLYDEELSMYYCEDTKEFFRQLSQITDYWDFSGYTSVSAEARYFYDYAHFRNAVGEMMLAKMFGNDTGIYLPEDFGWLVTRDNVEERLAVYEAGNLLPLPEARVPILLYHNLVEDGGETSAMTMEAGVFAGQMQALREGGYTAITIDEMLSYVNEGAPLPEKPVLITFDDGYRSNITLAAPILREYGMKATVFVVGVTVGAETYKDTGAEIFPHFTWEEALEYADVIDLQSHSYDLHRVEALDGENFRFGAIPQEGESEASYIQLFREDFLQSKKDLEANTGKAAVAFAYPHGAKSDLTEVLLSEMGVTVTFGTEEGVNTLVKGLPQSLRGLLRMGVYQETTGEQLLSWLED